VALLAQGCQQALFATAASVVLTSNGEWEGQAGPALVPGTFGAGDSFNMGWTPPQRLTRREASHLQSSLLGDVQQTASSTSTTKAPAQAQRVSMTLSPTNPFDLSDKLVLAKEEEKSREEYLGYRNSSYWEDSRKRRFWIDAAWAISICTFAFVGLVLLIVVFTSSGKSVSKGLGESSASGPVLQQQNAEGGATTEGSGKNDVQPALAQSNMAVSDSTPAESDAAVSNAAPVS